jgi:nucleoside-diphosphate-sugar epimerase
VDRRFLITGALGAIGVWTVRALLEDGHAVVALDVSDDGHRLPIALSSQQIDSLAPVRGDITDLAVVERAIDEHAVTDVIHLAALQVPFVRADPSRGARVNVVGTVNVLEAVRRRGEDMLPVVYASSIAALGGPGEYPSTLYGVFKLADEGIAARYFADFGVSSIGLRPHTVYGPGRDQGLTSAPTLAIEAAARGEPYRIPFGGRMQLHYARDVGAAFVAFTGASEIVVAHDMRPSSPGLCAALSTGAAAQGADAVVVLPAQTMADDRGAAAGLLPMGSLYEAVQLLFFDVVAIMLRERSGQSSEEMRARHTNLE